MKKLGEKKKIITQRQLHGTVLITEALALLLLIARIIYKAAFGEGTVATILMFLVCAATCVIVVLLATHRIEKDDELSEMNKYRAYFSTFWIFMALIMIGCSVFFFCAVIKDVRSFTVKISVDGIIQFMLIVLTLFNLCNSFYFLRFDRTPEAEEEE